MIHKHRNTLIGLLTVAGAVYLAADSSPVQSDDRARPVKRVIAGDVESAAEHREMRFSGVTRAVDRARLAFTLGGRLVERRVEVGDRVREGEVLAVLDDREANNAAATARGALAELRARRAQAERDLERAERLVAAKAATDEEVEKTRAALDALAAAEEAAEARLREAERLVDEGALRAPFAGAVTEVHVEPGEFVGPGRSVVVLSGDGAVELEVEVPATVVPRIRPGDEVTVHVPYLGRDVAARVDSVGRTAAGPGSLFPVVAELPAASDVVVGATAEMVLAFDVDAALSVPVEAVVNPGGRRPALFKVVGQRVEKVFVEVGSLLGDRVVVRGDAVASGALAAGDRVVVGGQRGLLDGESVEVVAGADARSER